MCGDCAESLGDAESVKTGLPPCKRGVYQCPHTIPAGVENPLLLLASSNLSEAISITNEVINMSSNDANGLPTADAFSFWSGEVAISERLFWKVVSAFTLKAKNERVTAINRNRKLSQ